METTTKIVALTTKTRKKLNIHDQSRGTIKHTGKFTYCFEEESEVVEQQSAKKSAKKAGKSRSCPELQWRQLCDDREHTRMRLNAYGVALFAYVRYDQVESGTQMAEMICSEVNDLCEVLSVMDLQALAEKCR